MKDNVDIYTISLIHAILDSKEYRAYGAIKRKLKDKPDLKKQINGYRKENFQLQNTSEEEGLFQTMEDFQRRHGEFLRDPLVIEYLQCELAVCRMLQKIAISVAQEVDLELDDIALEIRS